MSKQLRYSRWRRLPGLYRITEKKIPDHRSELQRLTLYVPGAVLDKAEVLAARAGASSVQAYCEDLLRRALEAEASRDREEHGQAARQPFVSLDALENDPDYLAEWSASVAVRVAEPVAIGGPADVPEVFDGPAPISGGGETPFPEETIVEEPTGLGLTPPDPVETVLRHAATGRDDPSAFLATLRRGEPIPPETAEELLRALVDLERSLGGASQIDRRLAYALHRLAFEGQILLTDAWPSIAADQATVDVLRMVQEAVDRAISGEDIRYYARETEPGPPP